MAASAVAALIALAAIAPPLVSDDRVYHFVCDPFAHRCNEGLGFSLPSAWPRVTRPPAVAVVMTATTAALVVMTMVTAAAVAAAVPVPLAPPFPRDPLIPQFPLAPSPTPWWCGTTSLVVTATAAAAAAAAAA